MDWANVKKSLVKINSILLQRFVEQVLGYVPNLIQSATIDRLCEPYSHHHCSMPFQTIGLRIYWPSDYISMGRENKPSLECHGPSLGHRHDIRISFPVQAAIPMANPPERMLESSS